MSNVRVNGTEIHYEVRGTGPPVLLITLGLLIRHPDLTRGAILHQPGVSALLDNPEQAQNALAALVTDGMDVGGPPAAMERYWRFVAGDANRDGLEEGLRQRMLSSAETFFGIEFPAAASLSHLLDDDALAGISVPIQVLASEQSPCFYVQTAYRLARHLHVPVAQTPGTHTPYLDHPRDLTQVIRPFLRQVSGVPA